MKRILALICAGAMSFSLLCACSVSKPPVMKVGQTEISAEEYNYNYYFHIQNFYANYGDYLSYFGLDPQKPLKDQPCSISEKEQTWEDYFMDQTEDVLTQVFTFYNAAKAENKELSEGSRLQVDAFVLSASEAATSAGKKLNDYLAENYGKGMTEERYREYLSHRLLATQYCDEKLSEIQYSEAQFESYYNENRDSIDKVDFRVYTMTEDYLPSDQKPSTEDEKVQALKNLADSFAEDLGSEEEFIQRAVEFAPESEKKNYASDAATLAKNISTSDLASTTMAAWLFDDSRVAGDVSVHKTSSGAYTVCYFVSRHRDEHPLVSMRHILLSVTEKEDGTSDDAQVYEEIQGLYSQWEKSGFTEASFVDLASKNTDDPGSKETGGLYESFAYGTMVSEINDWLYAEGRKNGDSAVIKTSFGYHIVWFLGAGEIAWKNECLPSLQDASYYELLEGLKESNPVSFAENHRESLGKQK